MNVDTSMVERILEALIRRTESGNIQWDDYRTGVDTTYSTSMTNGSILLRDSPMGRGELVVLDEAGQEVFRQDFGVQALAYMSAAGDMGGRTLAPKCEELLNLVKARARRSDQVLSSLLNEIESA